MILLVDIGNTVTKFKYSNNEKIYKVDSSLTLSISDFENTITDIYKIDGAAISSVVPKETEVVKEFIKKRYGVDAFIVTTKTPTAYHLPNGIINELGPDLMCTLEAGSKKYNSFLAINCGTATTFSLILNNEFKGCSICPGVETSHNALLAKASLIGKIPMEGETNILSLTTDGSVRGGTIYGSAFIVDGFISKIKKEYNMNNLKVIITGGNAYRIISYIQNEIEYDNDILFRGLENLYKENI